MNSSKKTCMEQEDSGAFSIRYIMICCTLILCLSAFSVSSSAFSFLVTIPPYDDPLSVSVFISPSMPCISDVETAYDNWDYLPLLETTRSYNVNYTEAYFAYSDISNGAYANTKQIGNSDWKQVICRPSWTNLTTVRRQEVVAHEMGHCWGLDHGTDDSLMRSHNFNDSAALTPDDVAGISALYGGS